MPPHQEDPCKNAGGVCINENNCGGTVVRNLCPSQPNVIRYNYKEIISTIIRRITLNNRVYGTSKATLQYTKFIIYLSTTKKRQVRHKCNSLYIFVKFFFSKSILCR